ncbi:MAG: phage portal protein [Cypionkella sp.]
MGYTSDIMAARASYLAGASGLGELTATAQSCISLWEAAFAIADVQGTDALSRRTMAIVARALALRGEFVGLITDAGVLPCADWDLSTRDGIPRAYRVSLSEAGGNTSQTVLAAEVVHFRIGSDAVAPWTGTPPLKRSALTAGLLHALETALSEVYASAPLGSQIVPFPEASEAEKDRLGKAFRGTRGRVILRESVTVSAAGGPAPAQDWSPNNLTPDLSRAMMGESLTAARGAICAAFGVLPSLWVEAAQGPLVREAQRQLAGWTLQPIAELMAEECREKLGGEISIDTIRPLQAHDAAGRARALQMLVETMGRVKELGLSPEQFSAALTAVNFAGGDDLA